MSCGSKEDIQVDHILPRSLYPKLALLKQNVQILCKKCNLKKSNVYIDDLRPLRSRLKFFIIRLAKGSVKALILLLTLHLIALFSYPSLYAPYLSGAQETFLSWFGRELILDWRNYLL